MLGASNFVLSTESKLAAIHPVAYALNTEAFSVVGEASQGVKVTPLSSARVNNVWSYTAAPPYVYIVYRIMKYKEIFSFVVTTLFWNATFSTLYGLASYKTENATFLFRQY